MEKGHVKSKGSRALGLHAPFLITWSMERNNAESCNPIAPQLFAFTRPSSTPINQADQHREEAQAVPWISHALYPCQYIIDGVHTAEVQELPFSAPTMQVPTQITAPFPRRGGSLWVGMPLSLTRLSSTLGLSRHHSVLLGLSSLIEYLVGHKNQKIENHGLARWSCSNYCLSA